MSFTLDTSRIEMSVLNDFAFESLLRMLVTLKTSRVEMSPVKVTAREVMLVMHACRSR